MTLTQDLDQLNEMWVEALQEKNKDVKGALESGEVQHEARSDTFECKVYFLL